MPGTIELISGDITILQVDAIINAANPSLLGGGGVDGAIHRAAGPELLRECAALPGKAPGGVSGSRCLTGEAVITGAGRLLCKKVIHTVGPIWQGGGRGEADLLAACYRNSLRLAQVAALTTVAFPNISTGVYGFPKEDAAEIAVKTVTATLEETPGISRVIFVCFDAENYDLYRRKLG